MITSRQLLAIMLGVSVAAGVGCRANADGGEDDAASQEGELRPLERKAIGKAVDYPADRTMRAKLEVLEGSQKARRAAAWKAVGRALTPIKVADSTAGQGRVDGKPATIPMFRTWYGKDDFERMFGKMIADRTAEDRKARRPFTATDAKRAFEWNATSLGASSDKDYFDRIRLVEEDISVQGLGGNHRVVYSPSILSHLMSDYGALTACLPKLATIKADEEPRSSTNFAPCFTKEFPEDAALVKMSWYRANFGDERLPLPTYDTSAATLTAKMNGTSDKGGWGKGVGTADPPDSSIYTVAMADGTRFRMPAMHLVTKELREWLWITIWWSDKPNEDFGADRPEEITKLGGPWGNYKMSVTVSYEEKDPDPRGGYAGSLGDALQAAYTGVGKPSWASNPYLEKGTPNAQSNCIGCHQHAGTFETSETILGSPDKFPQASRTKLRKNFPVDYLWAVTSAPESLAGIIDDRVKHYDQVDR